METISCMSCDKEIECESFGEAAARAKMAGWDLENLNDEAALCSDCVANRDEAIGTARLCFDDALGRHCDDMQAQQAAYRLK